MSEEAQFYHVCESATPVLDVIFVHGLTGSPVDTWSNGATDGYWPKWLCADIEGLSIYSIGYPASVFGKWAKQEMDLHELATHMLEFLTAYDIGRRPIVFITHSLGGLLTKEILRAALESQEDEWNQIAENTRLVSFVATPHLGAPLAAVVKLLVPRISSKHVKLLSNDSGFLSNLNQAYRDLATKNDWSTISYYEKFKTKNAALVVEPSSADPGAGNSRPVPIPADHISISKPQDRNALLYVSICSRIKKILTIVKEGDSSVDDDSFGADDYGEKSQSDRRTLLEKLIAADREHEYPEANGFQNAFAQKYRKHGLFSKERQKNDEILSAVQQRFITHVYQTKICKGASEDKIKEALQVHVIDAMTAPPHGKAKSQTAVLQALYFLTEQCHIKWDAP